MTREDTPGASAGVTPDRAFANLANETRIDILRTLAEAEGPLRFSEIRTAVGLPQGGQFTYHLDKLVGHFVLKSAEGYRLSQSGRRVVEAVLSGVVTEDPSVDRTRIDWPCERCGAAIDVVYEQERVERYCPQCAGTYGRPTRPNQAADRGYLGSFSLPPAGVEGRSPLELQQAAAVWGHLRVLTAVSGVCPSCAARVEFALDVCEDHDATDDLCDRCDNRYAVWLDLQCTNCIYTLRSAVGALLVVHPEVLAFLGRHGLTPFAPSSRYPGVVWNAAEMVHSVDPLTTEFTFDAEGESISVTVDETLSVVDTTTEG